MSARVYIALFAFLIAVAATVYAQDENDFSGEVLHLELRKSDKTLLRHFFCTLFRRSAKMDVANNLALPSWIGREEFSALTMAAAERAGGAIAKGPSRPSLIVPGCALDACAAVEDLP